MLEFPQQLRSLQLKGWSITNCRLTFPIHLTILILEDLYMTHGGIEQLFTNIRASSDLKYVYLWGMYCSDHVDSCRPALDLHRHKMLETFRLKNVSIESMLLPDQRETCLRIVELDSLTLTHHGIEQLCRLLSFCSDLQRLALGSLSCSEHGVSCCLPALDLQRQHMIET